MIVDENLNYMGNVSYCNTLYAGLYFSVCPGQTGGISIKIFNGQGSLIPPRVFSALIRTDDGHRAMACFSHSNIYSILSILWESLYAFI